MSFNFKGRVVTLNNYEIIFKGYSVDILDEIRSAILDDTPISSYINACRTNSYTLNQLRLATREYLPKQYLNTNLSGRSIKLIRDLYKSKVDISPISKYIPLGGNPILDNDDLELILETMYNGADISKVDFSIVPKNNIAMICKGLIKGYPMWLFTNEGKEYDNDLILQLIKGMSLGIDIHPFVKGDWNVKSVVHILSYSKRININNLMSNINSNFDLSQISAVIQCMLSKLDYELLCKKDSKGIPVFNAYQMYILHDCLMHDILTEEIYDPNLSDMDMNDLLQKEINKRLEECNRKLAGTLKTCK